VSSHFECLGFPLTRDDSSAARLPEIVRGLFEKGSPLPAPEGFHAVAWSEPGGTAAFAVLALADGAADLRCLTPAFLGPTRLRARVFRTLPDAECAFCDHLHGESLSGAGGAAVPFFAEVKDPAFSRDRDLRGAEVVVQVSLLAQHLHVYRDAADFLARRPEPIEIGTFVPMGLLSTPHRALARTAAAVREARVVENPLTGGRYHHARIGTDAGEMDLLAAGADLPEGLAPGRIVLAQASLLVRFPEGLPE
jgi:hypothetical protein